MGQLIVLLQRIIQIGNVVSLVSKIIDKIKPKKENPKLLPTPTDVLIDAIKKADQICYDMETVGLMLNSICDIEKKETLQQKLEQYGLPRETFDQMSGWNKNAQFGWSSFRDELKILLSERLTEEQKRDRVVHARVVK